MTLPRLLQRGVAAVRRRQDWVARAQQVDDLVPQDDPEAAPSHLSSNKNNGDDFEDK